MFSRILVPLDGSPLAERVLPHVVQFGRVFGSNVILLQVLDPSAQSETNKSVDPLNWQIHKAEADAYMKGVAERLADELSKDQPPGSEVETGKARVEYAIREGRSADIIVNFAHSENIDLLVISTHGSGGLDRWNMSSVTQKVIDLVYLPVLIVRSYHQPDILDSPFRYRRILFPIDTSRRAECALPAGIALARQGNLQAAGPTLQPAVPDGSSGSTKLILAAVIKTPEIPIPEPYPAEVEQLFKQLVLTSRQAVENYLNEMKVRCQTDCETRVVENDNVSVAIHDLADEAEDIDLVVLCAHGHTGQMKWPYGSIARTYIEHGTRTVLVIQDIPLSQVQKTAAEKAAEQAGRR